MAVKAKAAMGVDGLEVLADRGYFSGEEILACERAGVTPFVPNPFTSCAKAEHGLDGLAAGAHGLGLAVQPLLHGVDDGLMLPAGDAPTGAGVHRPLISQVLQRARS